MRATAWLCAVVLGSVVGCGQQSATPAADPTPSEATAEEAPASPETPETPTSEPPTSDPPTSEAPDEATPGESPTTKVPAKKKRPGSARKGTVITAGGSQFGKVLFDGTGQAIYLFDLETSKRSKCYDACAEAWPPVLTKHSPRATGAVQQDLLGTTKRDDGTRQVTYAGRPLYFYAHEGKDEVRCHNVPGFGGLWLAVTPKGDAA